MHSIISRTTFKDNKYKLQYNKEERLQKLFLNYYNPKEQSILVSSLSNSLCDYIDPNDSIRKDLNKINKVILCVIQNVTRCIRKRDLEVLVSLDKNTFAKGPVFNGVELKNKKLSYQYFRAFIDFLVANKYIVLQIGYNIKGDYVDSIKKQNSVITVQQSFIDLLGPYMQQDTLYTKELVSVVVLKDGKGGNKSFKITKKVADMIELLISYNDSLSGRISLDKENIEVFFSRVFQENFNKYGRFFDTVGAVQQLSGEVRKKLLIDNEPVVELDFCAMTPNIIYSKELINLDKEYNGQFDPYSCNIKGFTKEQNRALAKTGLLLLLNSKSKLGCSLTFNKMLYEDKIRLLEEGLPSKYHLTPEQYQETIPVTDILSEVVDTNYIIYDYFYKQNSSWLQNIESKIAEKVIDAFTQRGEVVLCIHDSFIVKESLEEDLEKEMRNAFEKVLDWKHNCKISKK